MTTALTLQRLPDWQLRLEAFLAQRRAQAQRAHLQARQAQHADGKNDGGDQHFDDAETAL